MFNDYESSEDPSDHGDNTHDITIVHNNMSEVSFDLISYFFSQNM